MRDRERYIAQLEIQRSEALSNESALAGEVTFLRAQVERLRRALQAAGEVRKHLRDHHCVKGGACWECALGWRLDDAVEDHLQPGDLPDIEETPGE